MAKPNIKKMVDKSKASLEGDFAEFSGDVETDLAKLKKQALERIQ